MVITVVPVGRKAVKKAASIRFDDLHPVPVLTAFGRGEVARAIIELAKAHQIPIIEDPIPISVLEKVRVGETIPPSLFELMASILAALNEIDWFSTS